MKGRVIMHTEFHFDVEFEDEDHLRRIKNAMNKMLYDKLNDGVNEIVVDNLYVNYAFPIEES